jgi:signal peptidase II
VVDFIDFRVWPTFNVADSVVVVGAVLLAIASLRTERHREPARTDDAPAG